MKKYLHKYRDGYVVTRKLYQARIKKKKEIERQVWIRLEEVGSTYVWKIRLG